MIDSLTNGNWKSMFDALQRLQELGVREAQVEAGVKLEEREALSLAGLPTLPPPRGCLHQSKCPLLVFIPSPSLGSSNLYYY
jgi:hypothetical protein